MKFYPQLVHENSLANPFSDFPIERQREGNQKNPDLNFLIEIHPEDGFLGGEIRFRISRSIGKSGFRFWKSKSGFPNQTHPKRSIDKIQWFVWNFIPSSFHWNGTVECRKVYELLTVAYLPSLAWGGGSNTLREWGTVKPDAHPLVACV